MGLLVAAQGAENAVVLESFEDSIDSATLGDWGGNRVSDGNVTLSQYTKTGAGDTNVTHGTKSLKVDLSASEGWVLDFKVTLSDDASNKIREAMKSTDVARYILRYDIMFPGGTSWMNSEVFLGDNSDQLDTPSSENGGKATMSIALDLITNVPEEGPITIRFGDNFDATEDPFVGPLSLYLDNIRLVDTYAPGAKPVTYVLQGFEKAANPTGGAADFTGWGGTPRTTYTQYTATGPDDIHVSEGTHALKVDYAGPGDWKADFTLPFAGTKLAEVLRLDLPAEQRPAPATLGRYTLRFEVTYPDRDDAGLPSWEVTAYDTLGVAFPYENSRQDNAAGMRQTVSITLDQLASWSDTAAGAPVLMFIAQADWPNTGSTLYYDNFRLIDTGATSATAPAPKITSVKFDSATSKVTVQWDGAAGTNYAIDFTHDLGSWPTVLAPSISGTAGTMTYTGTVPNTDRGFLRIRTN